MLKISNEILLTKKIKSDEKILISMLLQGWLIFGSLEDIFNREKVIKKLLGMKNLTDSILKIKSKLDNGSNIELISEIDNQLKIFIDKLVDIDIAGIKTKRQKKLQEKKEKENKENKENKVLINKESIEVVNFSKDDYRELGLYYEQVRGCKVLNIPKNNNHIKKIGELGYNKEDIKLCLDMLHRDSFWNDKVWDFYLVLKNIEIKLQRFKNIKDGIGGVCNTDWEKIIKGNKSDPNKKS